MRSGSDRTVMPLWSCERVRTQLMEKLDKMDHERRTVFELELRVQSVRAQSEARLKWLRAREKATRQIFQRTRIRLQSLTKDPAQYKPLMVRLIAEGLTMVKSTSALLRVREADVALVREIINDAIALVNRDRKQSLTFTVTIDTENPLPPAPERETDPIETTCIGGVIVVEAGRLKGRVLTTNTLDARLTIAFEDQLPLIRGMLFGIEDKSSARIPLDADSSDSD